MIPLTDKEKHRQIHREALATLGLYGIFFLWWFGWGYGLGSGSPESYTYLFGLPLWFLLSCLGGWLGVSLGVFWMVRCFFREIPFEEVPESSR